MKERVSFFSSFLTFSIDDIKSALALALLAEVDSLSPFNEADVAELLWLGTI